MEIGVLKAPQHFPRILTKKRGVLAGIFDLRRRPELDRVRAWKIDVTNPSGGVVVRTDGTTPFNRLANHQEYDFRWIIDLEGRDLHNRDLTRELDTRKLRFVINVDHGTFATRLRSPRFIRREVLPAGGTVAYGPSAAVTECTITFGSGGRVRLMADATETFAFPDEADTVYEISNSPPDVDPRNPNPGGGHFRMYYPHLFKPRPPQKFDLELESSQPAPDPALCGVTFLSLRRTSL
jgi:hypothetical protein